MPANAARPRLAILDSYALEPGDLDWSPLHAMADIVGEYPRTRYEDIIPRLAGAELAIVNKAYIDEAVLRECPALRWVGVTATGTDCLDAAACRRHGVDVSNVPGYSTDSVAQLAFALLLELCQCPGRRDAAVRAGHWQLGVPARFGLLPLRELAGKTLGIVGLGAIGRRMAALGRAMDMRVVAHTRTPRAADAAQGISFVPLETLLRESDVVSLHCPATPETRGLLNERTLALCRPGALIVNTARGVLVDEKALCAALCSGRLGGYGADVAAIEPLRPDSPLLAAPHTILTPHIGWATPEALARLAHIVCRNLRSFLDGAPENIVN